MFSIKDNKLTFIRYTEERLFLRPITKDIDIYETKDRKVYGGVIHNLNQHLNGKTSVKDILNNYLQKEQLTKSEETDILKLQQTTAKLSINI